MVIIPFIYFTLLTIYWQKKHKAFDICVFMSGLYALTSFGAVCIVYGDITDAAGVLFDRWNMDLNLLPTLAYCALHTICLLPFSLIYKNDLKTITPAKTHIIEYVSAFLIFIAVLNFYFVAGSTMEILSGDLETIRSEHYSGLESPAQIKVRTMPFIIQFLYYFNAATILALPIFFYNVCCRHMPWWWNACLFFTSLSMPIAGLQAADRAEISLYGLMLLFCLVFFSKMMPKKTKRILALCSIPFASLTVVYITAVTIARFDDRGYQTTPVESAIQYTGQGYLNFCYFWEYHKSEYIEMEREFPLIHHFFFKKDSNADTRAARSGKQGFFISVFPTYLGDILLDVSEIGLVIWVTIFFFVSVLIFKRPHREELDVGELMMLFVLCEIPIFGIFYYRYFYFTYSFYVFVAVAAYVLSKNKIVFNFSTDKQKDEDLHHHSDLQRDAAQLDSAVPGQPAAELDTDNTDCHRQ